MATYLSLLRWTKEGVEKIKDSPARLDAGKKAFEAAGWQDHQCLPVDGSIRYGDCGRSSR